MSTIITLGLQVVLTTLEMISRRSRDIPRDKAKEAEARLREIHKNILERSKGD